MNRRGLFIIAALAITGSAAQAQVPGFKHVKSIPLSSKFDGANTLGVGEYAADVAFDGTNAYVVGFTNGATPASQGVIKIDNVLGTETVGNAALWSTTADSAFMSAIQYLDNKLYVGLALGATKTNGNRITGYWVIDSAGTLDTSVGGGDGNIDGNDVAVAGAAGNQGIDYMMLDPLNPGNRPFAYMLRNRGFEWYQDASGALSPLKRNYMWDVANLGGGTAPAGWVNIFRATVFDNVGNMYMHNGTEIYRMNRRATEGGGFTQVLSAFDGITKIVTLGGTNRRTFQSVAWFPGTGSYGEFIAYNDRSTATDSATPGVFIAQPSGWGVVNTLTGAEPVGATTPAAWTEALKSVKKYSSGGKDYLFVVTGGVNDRLDIYEVTAPAVTVSGTLDLGAGWSGTYSAPGAFTVELRSGATVVDSTSANVAVDGTYSFTTSQQGTFDVVFKGSHWLSRIKSGVVIGSGGASGVNTNVVNGDVDGDDVVSVFDYIALSDAFDADPNAANWNAAADLDQDGVVSVFDYIILSDNFDLAGDLQN